MHQQSECVNNAAALGKPRQYIIRARTMSPWDGSKPKLKQCPLFDALFEIYCETIFSQGKTPVCSGVG